MHLRSVAILAALVAIPSTAAALDLPFKKSKLDNGLTVIVHEDHTLPTVTVHLAHRVGSRDDDARRTGLAHLAEHMSSSGTRRSPPKAFDVWMESAAATSTSSTGEDVTGFLDHGPPGALGLLLWLEADRLQGLGREIDQARLDVQRDVVRSERLHSFESAPYAQVRLRVPELLWPEGHPYRHAAVGSRDDLSAVSVDDVRRFLDARYVPESATLVVAGDVKPAYVDETIRRYFASIPARTPPLRADVKPAARLGRIVREQLEDRGLLAKIVMTFQSPARFAPGDADLDLFAALLGTGTSSRLYKALVHDRPLAQSVTASQSGAELGGAFTIEVVARPGVALDDLERAIDSVLAAATSAPPAPDELRRAKNRHELAFVRGLQSVEDRARLLATYEIATGDPGFVEQDLGRYRAATAESVLDWAKSTVTLGERVIVRVVPVNGAKAGAR
jgi:zinc protease